MPADELADIAATGLPMSFYVVDGENFDSDDDEPHEIEYCPL